MIKNIFMMFLLLVSFKSFSACYEHTKEHFSVSFNFTNNSSTKDLFYFHSHGNGKNKTKYDIWSNKDFSLNDGTDYDVVVTYIATSKDYGTLYVYLKAQGGDWQLIDENKEYYVQKGAITVDSDTVSLTCEEDILYPPVSQKPYELSEYCGYFENSVQSHSAIGNVKIDGNAFVLGEKNNFKLGFSSINDGFGLTEQSCRTEGNAWKCEIDTDLIVNPIALPSFPSGGEYLSIYDQNTHRVSPGKYASIEVGSTAKIIFSEGEYWVRNLTLNSSSQLEIRKGDRVKLYVERLEVNVNSRVNHVGQPDDFLLIGVGENASIHLTGKTTFNGLVYSENKVTLNSNFDFNNDVLLMPATITGAVTAKHLEMNSSSNVRGSSSCFSPPPAQDYRLTVTPVSDLSLVCESQPVEFQVVEEDTGAPVSDFNGQIVVSAQEGLPSGEAFWSFNEVADDKWDISRENTFSPDSQGKVSLWLNSDYVGTINITGRLSTDNTKQVSADYLFVPFKLEIQQGELKTVANKPRHIDISAKACANESGNNSIASGYTGERTLRWQTAYSQPRSGTANIMLKDKYGNWQSREGTFEFKAVQRGDTEIIRASSELKYADAGVTQLNFYDPNCTKESCDITPITRLMNQSARTSDGWERLEGTQTVATRPYTFALCHGGGLSQNIENASGTSEQGSGFVAAGESFDVRIKPVIWTEADGYTSIDGNMNATVAVDSSDMCGRQVTPNFYVDGAPAATVALSIPTGLPHSPHVAGASPGELTSNQLSGTELANIPFSASWNEVGSILLQADTQASYLGMDVNMGRRPVGRFYPAYVEIQSGNTYHYPAGQTGFAYLGQEFESIFSVIPKSKAGEKVSNYAFFNEDYQALLALEVVDDSNTSFGERFSPQGGWRDWTKSVTSMSWKLERREQQSEPKITMVESPWNAGNSQWGLYIAKSVDPTAIRSAVVSNTTVNDSQATLEMAPFAQTPALRYGRMILEDVTGRSDSAVTIPLRVEYWDGSEFVTNVDDSASWFDGNNYCKQIVSQSVALDSTSRTQGAGHVSVAEADSGVFYATPHTPQEGEPPYYLEQVRFWQKLVHAQPEKVASSDLEIGCETGVAGSQPQPWLLYNWRGKGDENPSALVTFGAYRGNDRVIYRGEKGINILLN